MSNHDNSHASANAIRDAQASWNNFIKGSTIVGGAAILVLVLMALFLV